jgi:hypothetical protein
MLAGQDDYGEKGTLMIVGDLNNPFTAGVVERRSSLSNSVKTIIPSLILIRSRAFRYLPFLFTGN